MKHLINFIKWVFNCSFNDLVTHIIISGRQSVDIIKTMQEINSNAELVLKNRREQITNEITEINGYLRSDKPDPFKASRISVVDFQVMNEPLQKWE